MYTRRVSITRMTTTRIFFLCGIYIMLLYRTRRRYGIKVSISHRKNDIADTGRWFQVRLNCTNVLYKQHHVQRSRVLMVYNIDKEHNIRSGALKLQDILHFPYISVSRSVFTHFLCNLKIKICFWILYTV